MKETIEYNGIFYDSERELCQSLNVNYNSFLTRKYKRCNLEECLFGISKKIRYKDVEYKNYRSLAKELNINYFTLMKRINRGLSLEEAINYESTYKWDVELAQSLINNTNMSYSEIAKELDINPSIISLAISKGLLKADKDRKSKTNIRKRKVNKLSLDGEILKTYNSVTEAEEDTGCNKSNISACCRGKVKTLGGYKWEYTD